MLDWEDVFATKLAAEGNSEIAIHRAEVPGGWLVLARGRGVSLALTYYPDQNHEWENDDVRPFPSK